MFLILRSAPEGRVSKDARLWRRRYRECTAFSAALAACCIIAAPAAAHGFGQRYDLPLPLSLYLFGTAAAVILSFVVVALFARHAPGARGYPRVDRLARVRFQVADQAGHPFFGGVCLRH